MNRLTILILVASVCLQLDCFALMYRPDSGSIWDPSVFYHKGKYHAFMMYNQDGDDGLQAKHCLYITSEDGVHWKDEKVVLEEREGLRFFKCFVGRCGERFIMNHGVARPECQDTLRFYESADLNQWEYLFSSNPDPTWYKSARTWRTGRWDHMYILPKKEGDPDAGYWGHVVSNNKSGPPAIGMMQSKDGREWEVLPPAKIEWEVLRAAKREWGEFRPSYFEWGGCERIDGKYYIIGGRYSYLFSRAYSMWTFVADHPRGPFRPDLEAFRLSGTSDKPNIQWLAAWARGKNGERLISNYASMPTYGRKKPWLLPLRKAIVDKGGHLRMGWWPGNEALKGESLSLKKNTVALNGKGKNNGYDIAYLDLKFDSGQGVVIEGKIKANALPGNDKSATSPIAGLILGDIAEDATAIQLGIGKPGERETHIGGLLKKEGKLEFKSWDVTGKGCATVSGIDDGKEHTFRLLCRLEMFELYIDDLLMQTYLHKPDSGKIGLVVGNAKAAFSDLKAWRMSFPASHDAP